MYKQDGEVPSTLADMKDHLFSDIATAAIITLATNFCPHTFVPNIWPPTLTCTKLLYANLYNPSLVSDGDPHRIKITSC